jgi:putative glutamine amidotransferase
MLPLGMPKPVVLITSDVVKSRGFHAGPRQRPRRPQCVVLMCYVDAVAQAGGLPLVVPAISVDAETLLERADAVVLTGGAFDIHPSHYGEEVSARLDRVVPTRTELELDLARLCLERGIPLLGICGGMQAMAVAAGGTLVQDLPRMPAHEQITDPANPWHEVRIDGPGLAIFDAVEQVNSTHHQAVRESGSLVVCGTSTEGVTEMVMLPGHPFALGVQWHPELLGDVRPYRGLVEAV